MLPRIDSAYNANWKAKGMKLFGLAKETDGKKVGLDELSSTNIILIAGPMYIIQRKMMRPGSSAGIPSYAQLYDVQSFPTLYLLDKDKRIIAKKVTLEQVDEILAHRVKNQ